MIHLHGLTAHRLLRALLCAALPGALVACTVGPDYQRPSLEMALPGHFDGARLTAQSDPAASGAGGAAEIAGIARAEDPAQCGNRWWRLFNDAGLDALVEQALRHSPDLALAEARIREARAAVGAAAGARLPQLNAEAGIARDHLSGNSELLSNFPMANPQRQFTDYKAGFDASWEIDLFGHAARQLEAARARGESAEAGAHDAQLRIAAETARRVIDYRALRLRLAVARNDAGNAADILRLVRLQRQAGLIAAGDVASAEDAAARAAAAPPVLDAAAGATLAALTVLTGGDMAAVRAQLDAGDGSAAGGTAAADDGSALLPIPVMPTTLQVGLPSDLLLRRADVRQMERRLAAATADIGVATADLYPRFSLVGSLGLDSVYPGQLTDALSRTWHFGPSLSLPLFNGGRLRQQVAARDAQRDAALADYRKAISTAVADTETALVNLDRERRRAIEQQRSSQALQRNLALARQRYEVGETTRIEMLQARRRLAAIDDERLQSDQAHATDMVALIKALGGGWTAVRPD